jgi:uncharacterized membrane protein
MKFDARDIALTAVFAALYVIINVLQMVSVGNPTVYGPVQLRIADCLIPLSALLGWPVVVGVTIGCLLTNAYYFIGVYDVVFGSVANFVAGLLVWKISGSKRGKITLNVWALIAVAFASLSFLFSWWFFKVNAVGYELDFDVYPSGFGGNLGSLIEILNEITNKSLHVGVFNQILNDLEITLYLVSGGAIVVLVGAFIRGNKGKAIIATGTILDIVGVYNFYNVWTRNWAYTGLAVSGSEELSVHGMQLAKVTWGWAYGIYLAMIACIFQIIAIIVPPKGLKANRFIGCSVAALAIGIIVGSYLWLYFPPPDLFGLALSVWAAMIISITLSSWIVIGVIGYLILTILSKPHIIEPLKSRGLKVVTENSSGAYMKRSSFVSPIISSKSKPNASKTWSKVEWR